MLASRRNFGLVDHDFDLRHSLLGALQVLCIIMIVPTTLVGFAIPGPLDLRSMVPPLVLTVGTSIQFLLWRRRQDTVVAYVFVLTMLLVTVVGTVVNGIRAPASAAHLLTIVVAGYLLGGRVAWRVGGISLLVLVGVYVATKLGILAVLEPPVGVWARVIAILLLISTAALAIPLRGLLSGVHLIDQERLGMEKSLVDLGERRNSLSQEVSRRTRELELANADLAAFSFSLSHDLQTPLRSIQGYAQALESATVTLTSRQKFLLETIKQGATSLDSDMQATLHSTKSWGEG